MAFYIELVFVFILMALAGAMKNSQNKPRNTSGGKTTFNAKKSYSKTADAIQKQMRNQAYRRHNEGYDQHTLDYCDSTLSRTSGGISFKNLPAGMDEMYYLQRYNNKREKELQAEIEKKQSSLDV